MPAAVAAADADNRTSKFGSGAALNVVTYPLKSDGKTPLLHAPPTSSKRASSFSRRNLRNAASHQRAFGIDIRPTEVIWRGWKPGEEYTKTITLKNTQIRTQKIRYNVPSTPLFSTVFPQVIILSAGTSFTLPLTFKPLEKVHYEDKVEFITSQGTLSVPLKALLPETRLSMPESLRFGLVAAHDSLEITFQLENMSSELITSFSWDVPDPFSIFPPTGSIPPRGSCTLKANFRPMSATVFEANAVCCFGEEHLQKRVKLEGIGKFPHLILKGSDHDEISSADKSVPTLDFGGVEVHETSVKSMTLQNLSNVRVPFKIRLVSFAPDTDRVFTCSVKEGIVPPTSEIKVPIRFQPTVVCQSCIDYFEVCPIGLETKSTIKCQGYSKGPIVKLSQPMLDFGLAYTDKEIIRTVDICNESSCEAIFQIMLDPDSSLWHTSELSGVLQAGETRTLHVSFTPVCPIPYYRRLTILVHNQGPLFLDLIGTCHNAEHHPPLLKPIHLENYKVHAARGLTFFSPQTIFQLLKEQKIKTDNEGYLTMLEEDENNTQVADRNAMAEYFDDAHNSEVTLHPPHVSLDKQDVWLGKVEFDPSGSKTRHVSVRLTNHTRGKITAIWIQDPSGVFEVIPAQSDIPPLKVSDFRVVFRPLAPNQFFGAELECYASYKSMRDYKLVDDLTTTPPWCVTMSASGHTFSDKKGTFLPQIELGPDRFTFSATCGNEPSYRTILLENMGTTPLLYQFTEQEQSEESTFTIKPRHGMSKSKYHISACRLQPTKVQFYNANVTLRLNDNETHDKKISLVGTGEQPELLLANNGEMYFQPTCTGSVCSNTFAVQNTGRLSTEFMWKIPVEADGKISVEPKQGVILPNEIQHHTWTFAPTTAEKHLFKPVCYAWLQSESSTESQTTSDIPAQKRRKFVLRIIGEGHSGDIKCEQSCVEFGSVLCGSMSPQSLILRNTSNCDLRFRLTIEQTVKCPYGDDTNVNFAIALTLDHTSDKLPARSRTAVAALAKPLRRGSYNWSVFYEIINEKGENIDCGNRILLCELSAEAVYPCLSVIDAQTFGSGSNISKTQLWRWFNLDHFNFALDGDPDDQELMYSVSTRRSVSRRPAIYTRSIMEFNFGAAPLDSETCYVSLMLKNTGAVNTEWSFLYPKDLQIPMDYWSETGVFNPDELHEAEIQDNKLITVSPRKGHLRPGETCAILLQYKHDITGTHRIPVLFKVENGREILLNMVGVTVEPGRRYIHFPGSKHDFNPVPIGGPSPPKQLYEIYNGGSVSVMYEVNLAPLLELQDENFDHQILTCLNPQGEVVPGTCANVEFIFSPLEARTYMVDVPIHIVGGDVAMIAFSGIGYDTRMIGSKSPLAIQPPEFTGVPKSRSIEVEGQNVFLSEEGISFGNVPLFSRNRSIFFISNASEDRAMRFSWHAASDIVNEVLRIEPVQGRLQPGEHLLTKVTFCATGQPSFYDLDLICEVVDETKMEEYQTELASWEEEKARQEVEFAIYEDDVQERVDNQSRNMESSSPRKMTLENVLNKSLSPMRLSEAVEPTPQKSEMRMYETLPPIRSENPIQLPSNRTREVRRRLTNADDTKWPQPLPPDPFVLHLGITACTHDISEYRTNFPEKGGTHFIDRMLQISHPIPSRSSGEHGVMINDFEERDAVTNTLSKIIRGVLDDTTFHTMVRNISEEKTPFFQQLPREPSSKTIREDESNITEGQVPVIESENSALDSPGRKIKTLEKISAESQRSKTPDRMSIESRKVKTPDEPRKVKTPERALDETRKVRTPEGAPEGTRKVKTPKKTVEESPATNDKPEIDLEIKRSPFFGSLLEEILSSTISNIMTEAFKGEVVLTARPRLVALPPSSAKQETVKTSKEKRNSSNSSSRNSNSSRSKSRKTRSRNSSSSSNRHSARKK